MDRVRFVAPSVALGLMKVGGQPTMADPCVSGNAEYPMVRWLERNGYSVSYFTGVDTDRRGGLLTSHRNAAERGVRLRRAVRFGIDSDDHGRRVDLQGTPAAAHDRRGGQRGRYSAAGARVGS